ncbi:hypothetical protein Ahy_B08g090005 [Arachis hypogaea]|uniref:Transposase MuDR plant domain-containing protein n=1 Tax=Arachis hypogaea TaxID=3818 RepID=A0A444XZC3_ARAHY|nr:hypothetical protein Ahy_B08g090005 [Arachis hypogaea]
MEYKILESDHLKYSVQYTQFGTGCQWSIRVSYRRKQEKWEVRRYNGPYSCLHTSTRQDHRRLDSKVIAQAIFTMVGHTRRTCTALDPNASTSGNRQR